MTKISVLIPDGESTLTKHVVHCLAMDKNIDIHVLSKDPAATIRHSRLISSFHVYDPAIIGVVAFPDDAQKRDSVLDELIEFHYYDAGRAKELIEEIRKVAALTRSKILLPVDEHIVKILSGYKHEINSFVLPLLMPDKAMFDTAINKWELAQFLKDKKEVPHPLTVNYSKGADPGILGNMKFPVIIKPIDQGNAQGIETFERPEDLDLFFESQQLKHEYIVQPLIDGYDIDCSVLCNGGKIVAYTIQKGIVLAKVRFRAAVGIEFLYDERVLKVVTEMMKLLNWSGVAHIDLRYDSADDEIKVIEINARFWGSLMGSLNAGINFPVLAVKVALGEEIEAKTFEFNRYFMGKAPLKRLAFGLFQSGKERVRLRDTSLFYTLKDPMPVFFEMISKVRTIF